MTARTPRSMETLYERDYVLWTEKIAEQLRRKNFADVDWENVIEEIESTGRSERRAIESLLTRLLEHLLKIEYWESERERNIGHWSLEITNFRARIARILADSPSLKPYTIEIFPECYAVALRGVSRAMRVPIGSLPETPIASLEQTLDDNWFPLDIDRFLEERD